MKCNQTIYEYDIYTGTCGSPPQKKKKRLAVPPRAEREKEKDWRKRAGIPTAPSVTVAKTNSTV